MVGFPKKSSGDVLDKWEGDIKQFIDKLGLLDDLSNSIIDVIEDNKFTVLYKSPRNYLYNKILTYICIYQSNFLNRNIIISIEHSWERPIINKILKECYLSIPEDMKRGITKITSSIVTFNNKSSIRINNLNRLFGNNNDFIISMSGESSFGFIKNFDFYLGLENRVIVLVPDDSLRHHYYYLDGFSICNQKSIDVINSKFTRDSKINSLLN